MLIPYFWAESRLQNKLPTKQITVKRWGWSDVSQQEAQALADRRANEAMVRIINGENLRRRELKDSYGTEDGVPIREEVVSRHESVLITRNSYGSLCLNTPNVLFADVDAPWRGALSIHPLGCLLIVLTGIIAGAVQKSVLLGASLVIGVPWLWSFINHCINQRRRPLAEAKAKQENLEAIRAFAATHPEWHLRVYQTPAGYRLLAMHDVFDPQGEISRDALKALSSDKRFATLCALQSCFRARVSPKYWRIGYKPKEHLPKSKWPFPPEHLPRRREWVAGYEARISLGARKHLSLRMHDRDHDKLDVKHYHAPYPAEYRLNGKMPESLKALARYEPASILAGLAPVVQLKPVGHWFAWSALGMLVGGVLLRRI